MSMSEATQALLNRLRNDSVMQSYFGAAFPIRNSGETEGPLVPGMAYTVVGPRRSEVFMEHVVRLLILIRDDEVPAIDQMYQVLDRIEFLVERRTYSEDLGYPMGTTISSSSQGDDPEAGVVRWDVDITVRQLRA